MDDDKKFFTIVFEGDIGSFKRNPLKTDTPFGIPYIVARGNALEELGKLKEETETEAWNAKVERDFQF